MVTELQFNADGTLPPGDYEMSLDEIRNSILVQCPSPDQYPNWDSTWRRKLVDHLEILVNQLRSVAIREIFVDGSFAEDKEHPTDIDGYFLCNDRSHELMVTRELEARYGVHWDYKNRIPSPHTQKRQLKMWHIYRVDLFPHYPGKMCGIKDKFGNDREFPAAFRVSRRTDEEKGILRLKGPVKP